MFERKNGAYLSGAFEISSLLGKALGLIIEY
jgi:hypothetical protein